MEIALLSTKRGTLLRSAHTYIHIYMYGMCFNEAKNDGGGGEAKRHFLGDEEECFLTMSLQLGSKVRNISSLLFFLSTLFLSSAFSYLCVPTDPLI